MNPLRTAPQWVLAASLSILGIGCGSDPPTTPPADAAPDTPLADNPGTDTPPTTDTPTDRVTTDNPQPTDTPTDNPPTDNPTPTDTPDTDTPKPTDTPATDVDTDAGADVISPMDADDAAADVTPPDDSTDAADVADAGECRTSADCTSSAGGAVCDTATNRCVRCTTAEDTCPVGNYCGTGNACVPGCRTVADCGSSGGGTTMRCDTATHMCVGCVGDDDCALGSVCRSGTCAPGCTATHACGAGSTCCTGSCVNTQTDGANCGMCGTAVMSGQTCCAGVAANTQTDPTQCGACGMRCTVANGVAGCAGGTCTVASCNAGFANCDMDPSNGCETNTGTSAAHCGTCATVCTAGTGAMASCTAGVCTTTCTTGLGDCNMMASDGCEANLATTAANCGRCGNVCPARANATATCAASACGIACNTGFGNCNGNATDGCEINLQTTVNNCGTCGRACTFANAAATCVAGACAMGACNTGFANCDGNPANGCEIDVRSNRANCGTCGTTCSASAICFNSACSTVCTPPLAVCPGSTCADLTNDVANCGACGTRCPATPANGASVCRSSACALNCNRGFASCNTSVTDGCEINIGTSVTNCGACGNVCSFANAAATCVAGACVMGACTAGFGNCDGNPANGCETNLRTTTTNCSTCGRACTFQNAAATCAAAACVLGTCTTGFGNCDRSADNGCETDLGVSSLHCGACGRACTAGQACSAGTCVAACPSGTSFCSGGCYPATRFQTDAQNCGACGTRCATGQACIAGACVARPANDTRATATPLNLSTTAIDLTATTVGATHDIDVPCLGSTVNQGADVFYSFTLTRREFFYADTNGNAFDTALFLVTGAGDPVASSTGGDRVCNDDSGCFSGSTGVDRFQSQIYTVLDPGSYYLVLSGYSTNSGATPVHVEHLPAGSGSINPLPAGATTQSGTTAGTVSAVSSLTCGGAGAENTYWWIACPGSGAGTLTATTCDSAAFDTVLHLLTGTGERACNDDSCGLQSNLSTPITSNARLRLLYVDGWNTAAVGTYSVRISRP